MSHNRPIRAPDHSSNMYDDRQPYAGDFPSQSSNSYRKDNQASGPNGSYGERSNRSAYNERRYERSRSPRREGRGRYRDRDQEGYESPRNRSRSRSPYFGAPPSSTVILEGLPLDMAQEDILNELQRRLRVEGIEEVRLIKDKKTGLSRQFAFAQFAGIPEARSFLEQYYPSFDIYGAYDPSVGSEAEPTRIRVAYSREKDDRNQAGKGEDDWKCDVCYLSNYPYRTMCHRCNAPRTRASAHGIVVAQTNMSSFSGFATTGDSDASPDNAASQFLLVRGLEPGVNEELLSKGISKLYKQKPNTTAADSHLVKKKITSTSNDSSLGAKEGSLQRILLVRDRKSNDSWRYGFAEFNTVDDAQAAYLKYKASDRFTIASKPVVVSYIHAGVFVPVLNPIEPEFEQFTFSPLHNSAIKLMYWDETAYVNEHVTAIAPPLSSKPEESEHVKLAAAAANEGLLPGGKEGEPKAKRRKVEKDPATAGKKAVAPHLQFWSNRHAEIHGLPTKDDQDALTGKSLAKSSQEAEAPPSQTFADMDRKCCLLCARQFKTDAEVNKHERISQLHRDNMKNETLVATALAKLSKKAALEEEGSEYRDRAKERRSAFNQPKQPATQQPRSQKESPSAAKEMEAPPAPSKGAALLGKMGWTAGEGLGAQGTGRTEAIAPELYSQGVGLGAVGGKIGDATEAAQQQTKSTYADFVQTTKSKAKERYERLS